jgi:DNA-binding SARP family transcriptional activator
MSEPAEKLNEDKVDHALKRLAAAYIPPEVSDFDQWRIEFRRALQDLSSEALIEGISDLIRNRKHRTFPGIGEIRQACLQSQPMAPKYSASMPQSVSADDEERRRSAIAMLAHHPQVERLIENNIHNRVLEFILETGRMPAAEEWFAVKKDHAKVQAHIAEALGPAPHAMIATMAEAIMYRRTKLTEEIRSMQRSAAE